MRSSRHKRLQLAAFDGVASKVLCHPTYDQSRNESEETQAAFHHFWRMKNRRSAPPDRKVASCGCAIFWGVGTFKRNMATNKQYHKALDFGVLCLDNP